MQANPNFNPHDVPAHPEQIPARHGFQPARVLLQYEDGDGWLTLRAGLVESWQPANAQESLLVDQIAQVSWRMQRFTRVETGTFDFLLRVLCDDAGAKANPHGDEGIAILLQREKITLAELRRCQNDAHRQYLALINQLSKLQDRRHKMTPKPPAHEASPMLAAQNHGKEKAFAAGSNSTANKIAAKPESVAGRLSGHTQSSVVKERPSFQHRSRPLSFPGRSRFDGADPSPKSQSPNMPSTTCSPQEAESHGVEWTAYRGKSGKSG
jgi:hypothetical protein